MAVGNTVSDPLLPALVADWVLHSDINCRQFHGVNENENEGEGTGCSKGAGYKVERINRHLTTSWPPESSNTFDVVDFVGTGGHRGVS